MSKWRAVITDHVFADVSQEERILADAGCELTVAQCKTPEQVIAAAAQADALLVQWAPITAAVMAALERCKVIVRYGIGVDNVDLAAAQARGIPVCNVPDYCIDEVADHTLALALSLARQLPMIQRRMAAGVWRIVPDKPMPAFGEMVFATAGFGRVARATLDRARAFRFQLAAYDPYAPDSAFAQLGVTRLGLDELFSRADILSLHSPLTPETRRLLNAQRLARMKRTAIVVNTARGGLIDTDALARALMDGTIAAAGLDVFETEPLPADHPLLRCENVAMTSHVAWFSQSSVPKLQGLAALEVARALRGEPLLHPLFSLAQSEKT
jgi:D-3-phosphoglycerate dehydrogenase